MRSILESMKILGGLASAARTADADTGAVSLAGYNGALVLLDCGAEGITLSETNYIQFVLYESDDGSTFTAVDAADVKGATAASGVIMVCDAAAEAPAQLLVEYIGYAAYLKVVADYVGTHGTATPCAISVIGHDAIVQPTY